MLTAIEHRVWAMAALPPPPEPGANPGNGADQVVPLVALGLVLAAGVALIVGARRRRSAVPSQRRLTGTLPTYRIEHWHNGESTVLGSYDNPGGHEDVLLVHAARLQARGESGTLVLVEQASDHIVILRPL